MLRPSPAGAPTLVFLSAGCGRDRTRLARAVTFVNLVDCPSSFLTRVGHLRVGAHAIPARADKRIPSQSLSGQRCSGGWNRRAQCTSPPAPRNFLSRMVAAIGVHNARHKTLIQSGFCRTGGAWPRGRVVIARRARAARLIRFCCAGPDPRVGSLHFDGGPRSNLCVTS